jgi:hypothetical protein
VTVHPYHKKLGRALERMGALYTVNDILDRVAAGTMQSFTEGDSWAITQICVFPRARVLEILLALGSLEDCFRLHDRILQFARANDIGLIQAYGRKGWWQRAKPGWKIRTTSYLYQRDM